MAREFGRWFRFYDAVLDDPKAQRLSDRLFRAWVNLLCVASRNGGRVSSDFKDIAFALRISEGQARDTVQALVSADLIDQHDDGFEPHNWSERQFKSDVTDTTATERQRRKRERDKGVTVTRDTTVTKRDTSRKRKRDSAVTVTAIRDRTEQSISEQKDLTGLSAPPKPPAEFDEGLGNDEAAAVGCYWNNIAEEHGLASVRRMTDGRRKKIKLRLSEAGGLGRMAEILDSIPSQPFLLGQNDRHWKIDFDWLLEPSNFVKVEERKYANV